MPYQGFSQAVLSEELCMPYQGFSQAVEILSSVPIMSVTLKNQ